MSLHTFSPKDEEKVYDAFAALKAAIHGLAVEKGWHEHERAVPEYIALCHSELSEALEAYRELPEGADITAITFGENGKPEGVGVELADAIIRIIDMAAALGIDIASAILAKHEFNCTREYRHGGRRA